MTDQKFTIGIIQQPCGDDDARVNVDRGVENIRKAKDRGAQIICLPEMFNSPYFCKVEEQKRFDIAEPIPGPSVERMQSLAKELGVVIIVPIFERRAAGVYHNSAAVVDADGSLLGIYRKMHIPDDPLYYEKFYFAPGEADGGAGILPAAAGQKPTARGFQTFDTKFARIGVLICWDQWYPEAARITSLMGAEVLFFPTAIGWHPKEKSEFGEAQADAWRTAQRAHAIANGVYVASPNRVGLETEPGTDGIEFFGRSFIADPFGRIIADGGTGKPDILVAEVDRNVIEDTRRHWPFLRDRRIDAYGPILNRWIDR